MFQIRYYYAVCYIFFLFERCIHLWHLSIRVSNFFCNDEKNFRETYVNYFVFQWNMSREIPTNLFYGKKNDEIHLLANVSNPIDSDLEDIDIDDSDQEDEVNEQLEVQEDSD
ncbi:hypothetical protein HHI36_014938 [Cryptolaemus montrouzieri]|uniref:Uncharacterized protein n=1 Tax=Cryptolaemus montrouzieri TaxID=559131 RepID=A0ABD2N4J2_9CUCU